MSGGGGANVAAIARQLAAYLTASGVSVPTSESDPGASGPSQAAAWARSGAMALTGDADGPPLAPAAPAPSVLEAAATLLHALAGRTVIDDPAAILGERAALLELSRHGTVSCGGATRLLRAADGWVAVGLPRPEDRAAVPAWLDTDPGDGDPWPAVTGALADLPAAEATGRARMLEIPSAALAELAPGTAPWRITRGPAGAPVETPLVADLSALWAGPLCADLLRRAGADVVKVEDPARPDGGRAGPPEFFDLLNGGKRSVAVDLRTDSGRRALGALLTAADVVVSSSRPRAFEQLGIDVDAVLSRSPTVWIAITAYGWSGPGANRVGFGDDAAVAGGLATLEPSDRLPRFAADAVADPLTGVLGALAGLAVLRVGGSWLIDTSLAAAASCVAGLARGPATPATPTPATPTPAMAAPARPTPPPPTPATATLGGWELDGAPVAPPRARTSRLRASALGSDSDEVLDKIRPKRA